MANDGPGVAIFFESRTLAMKRAELSLMAAKSFGLIRAPWRLGVVQLFEGVLVCGGAGGER